MPPERTPLALTLRAARTSGAASVAELPGAVLRLPDGVVRVDGDGDLCWLAVPGRTAATPFLAGADALPPARRPPLAQVAALRGLALRPRRPAGAGRLVLRRASDRPPLPLPSEQDEAVSLEGCWVVGAVRGDVAAVSAALLAGRPMEALTPAEQAARLGRGALDTLAALPGCTPLEPGDGLLVTPRLERAADQILQVLLQPQRRAVLLPSDAGSGKSVLLQHLARRFAALDVPGRLGGQVVARLGAEVFLPGTSADEEAQRTRLRQHLARLPAVFVIDEAARLVRGDSRAPLDALLLAIDEGLRVVLASDQGWSLLHREALGRRLTLVPLPPADADEALAIAHHVAAGQAAAAGLDVTAEALQRVVRLARLTPFVEPHASVALVTAAIARAEARGLTELTAADVDAAFRERAGQGDAPPLPLDDPGAIVRELRARGFYGHDALVEGVARQLVAAGRRRAGRGGRTGPGLAVVLAGGPGTGKSTFVRALHGLLAPTDVAGRRLVHLAGSALTEVHQVAGLRGAPPSYVGYGDGSPLGNRLKQTGSALTIHVSELELAHPSLQTLLASLLDGELVTADGSRLPVGEGVTVVIETNATASARVRGSLGFGAGGASAAGARTAAFGAAVDALLDPRLSSRIAALGRSYVLGPLGPADVAAVLQHAAREAGRPYGVEVHLSDDAAADLAARARDPEGGARPALGLLAEEVLARLDDRLAAGPPPTRIEIRREDGRLVLDTGEE